MNMDFVRSFIYRLLRLYGRIFKPTILGSRALVIREQNGIKEVLLVRMSYVKGWYLPGGGLDRGENFFQAIERELNEECGLSAEDPELFGLYHTDKFGRSDHVAVFVIQKFQTIAGAKPDPEIKEWRFAPVTELPGDTTPATRRRIAEWLGESAKSRTW